MPRLEIIFGDDATEGSGFLRNLSFVNECEGLVNLTRDIVNAFDDALEALPFSESQVYDYVLEEYRYVGILDVFPPSFSIRTLPDLMSGLGVMIVESLRFVADTIHTGNFEDWEFLPGPLINLLNGSFR
jgi:hypothetical protein